MKLVSFTVEKYRSITKAKKITMEDKVILVGPNNEGKSNILRALVTAMNILTRGRGMYVNRPNYPFRFLGRRFYDWPTDFPIHLQNKNPQGESTLILEFSLTDDEMAEFRKEIKSRLTGTLPIKIVLSAEKAEVTVYKKGPGSITLNKKSARIARFVAEKLDFQHIPAVRTAQSAQKIVTSLVDRELAKVESNPAYIAALEEVESIQKPILDILSAGIRDTLVKFLPNILGVEVQIPKEERYRALRRSCQIVINDGTPTLLQYKGDGVQSLAALGIMRHASEEGAEGKNLVVAIEEPESHLHPDAIHELKNVINELSKNHQVVLTTHCPLFVDRLKPENNIIVNNKRAVPARRIDEVRQALGVRASDNLRNAELVLLVEGRDDAISLSALLAYHSLILKAALGSGNLAIDYLGGGSNLPYKVGLVRDALCSVHCFLDDDKCGHDSFGKAKNQGMLVEGDVNFAICEGMKEAEIEDLYNTEFYAEMVEHDYRVTLRGPKFNNSKKWSERMRDVFRQQGKRWNDEVEAEAKEKIAKLVLANPQQVLNDHRKGCFDGLVSVLEARLTEREH